MEYNKLIAVTGQPGLFELLSSKNDGAIVRSLDDQSTKFVSSRGHQFSHLESIEVYTVEDNVNLAEVFLAMQKSSVALPDPKDAKALKTYFTEVYPNIDFERVYTSDLKKMVKWLQILVTAGVEIKLSGEEEEVAEEVPAVEEAKA
jgi:hypothetical protein